MHGDIIREVNGDLIEPIERRLILEERAGIRGYGAWIHLDENMSVRSADPFENRITDAGDQYIARKIITAGGPAAPAAPTIANGMKLGTGSAAVTKNGTNAALGSYLAGTNVPFDATFLSYTPLGAGAGTRANHQSTFGPGVGTSATVNEAIICNDAGTNATSSIANTYARILGPSGTLNKAAGDTLIVVWYWLVLAP